MDKDRHYEAMMCSLATARAHALSKLAEARDTLLKAALAHDPHRIFAGRMTVAAANYKALATFVHTGQYADLQMAASTSSTLAADYLRTINKCHYGFNSFHNNVDEVEKLVKRRGYKEVQERYTKFLIRTINDMAKGKHVY